MSCKNVHCIVCVIPEISLQDHDVLHLDLLNPVPVHQEVKVSIECKNKNHQANHDAINLNKFNYSLF